LFACQLLQLLPTTWGKKNSLPILTLIDVLIKDMSVVPKMQFYSGDYQLTMNVIQKETISFA